MSSRLNEVRRFLSATAILSLAVISGAGTLMAPPTMRVLQVTIAPDGASHAVVSPMNGEGRALRGLVAANFQVEVNDKPISPITVAPAQVGQVPLSVVLGIDISGSMHGEKMDGAIKGASAFVDRLAPNDMIALVTFGTDVRELADFTADHEQIKRTLAGLKGKDKETHLYQALFDSLDRVSRAPTNRGAVILLTDGRDEGSALGPEEVLAKITAGENPVYTLGYGRDADTKTLKRFAAASHGEFYMAPAGADLAGAYKDIADQLQNDFQVNWTTTGLSGRAAQVKITLKFQGQSISVTEPATLIGGDAVSGVASSKPRISWWSWLVALLALLLALAAFPQIRRIVGNFGSTESARTVVLPSVWVEVVKGADMGMKSIVFGKEAIIGRDPRQAKIVIKHDPVAGRGHARLSQNAQGLWMIEDMQSQNGTTVNGIQIFEPVTLQSDDRIGIGLTELLFIDKRRGA